MGGEGAGAWVGRGGMGGEGGAWVGRGGMGGEGGIHPLLFSGSVLLSLHRLPNHALPVPGLLCQSHGITRTHLVQELRLPG
jgi:hypothetical protein